MDSLIVALGIIFGIISGKVFYDWLIWKLETSCKNCGHNKDKHQYQRDSQSHTGKCNVWKLANDKVKHPCWCQNYATPRSKGNEK